MSGEFKMNEMKQFEYVIALSKYKNFSQAASSLNISQSSLSQYIKRLEKELGVQLFERSVQNFKLTESGEIYLRAAYRIMDIYSDAQSNISDSTEGVFGTMCVGISPSRAPFILPTVVTEFKERHPNVILNFVECTSSEIINGIDEGSIDLAYTFSGSLENANHYMVIPANTEELMVVCSKDKSLQIDSSDGKMDFSSVVNEEFVVLTDGYLVTDEFNYLCNTFKVSPKISVSVSRLSTAISIVKAGGGFMLLPSSYKNYGDLSECLNFYSLKKAPPPRQLAIVAKKDKYLNKSAKTLIEIFKRI